LDFIPLCDIRVHIHPAPLSPDTGWIRAVRTD
jgi:hypothetical protein